MPKIKLFFSQPFSGPLVPESLFRRKSDRQLEMMMRSKVFIVNTTAKLIFAV